MTTDTNRSSSEACSNCEREMGRRAFLRKAGLAAAATLAALGVAHSAALAAVVRPIEPNQPPRDSGAIRRGATRSYRVPTADGVYVDSGNEVILARVDNQMYAFSTSCPHRGTTLEWRPSENRVFCPRHKARFRPDGAHDSGRESRDLDRYDIRRAGDSVVVDLDALRRADKDMAAWRAAVVTVA